MKNVVLVGSGNVAEALARALGRSGIEVVQVFARNPERGRFVARLAGAKWSDRPEELARADLYLISVSDKAVSEVAASLRIPDGAVVAHTAGSVPLDALPATCIHRAVLYPLQTFTRGREVDFRRIPLFLECSSEEVRRRMEAFAARLSDRVHYADSEQRARLHLAGVFSCNFPNHLFALAERIVRRAGLDFDVLRPLVAETAAKALDAASPAAVQTGPAVRHDLETQARHRELLAEDVLLDTIYSSISQSIWETSRKI